MMRPRSTRSPAARGAALQRGSALPPPAIRAVRSGSSGSSSSSINRVRGVRAAAAGAASGDAPPLKATEGPTAVGRQGSEALSELRQLRAAVEQLGATAAELRAGQEALLQELAAQRAAAAKEARIARLQRAQALIDSRLVAGNSTQSSVDGLVTQALALLVRGSTEFSMTMSSARVASTQAELKGLTGLRFRKEQRQDGEAGGQERTWLVLVGDASS
ncbi:hypothetical protein HXX76_002548 [Chlamydomonas incerta]|uniref:Uncharacterized protein n=1 Tax=Chlamydomonas incerta TaxID=51695 RepID=A0A835TBJ8_CHLIN|nr:hypothetical protein HXX76_002548 [Chlamydomonas incerta]|eukprot:KAG2442462.1 hypothetical protein HXX76_002548 [Chlamydomonas incerta]